MSKPKEALFYCLTLDAFLLTVPCLYWLTMLLHNAGALFTNEWVFIWVRRCWAACVCVCVCVCVRLINQGSLQAGGTLPLWPRDSCNWAFSVLSTAQLASPQNCIKASLDHSSANTRKVCYSERRSLSVSVVVCSHQQMYGRQCLWRPYRQKWKWLWRCQ